MGGGARGYCFEPQAPTDECVSEVCVNLTVWFSRPGEATVTSPWEPTFMMSLALHIHNP